MPENTLPENTPSEGAVPAGDSAVNPAGEGSADNTPPRLLGPAQVRSLAERLGVTPTKKLGQNFVHDPNTVRKIIRLADVKAGQNVLEIGPGLGSLTLGLTEVGARVTAVEIDDRLASWLPETVAHHQPDAQLSVVHSDALAVESLPTPPELLVANLPYNVSVPILMHLLESFPSITGGLVMVQQEVGERIQAAPNSKIYGAPSAKAAWYGRWTIAGSVSRKIFWPVPGVDSVLVGFQKYEQPLGSEEERQLTFELINAAFANRRKMLRQSLQTAVSPEHSSTERVTELLKRANIAETARAENLSVTEYLAIARAILEH